MQASFAFEWHGPPAMMNCEPFVRLCKQGAENGWRRKLHHEICWSREHSTCQHLDAEIPAGRARSAMGARPRARQEGRRPVLVFGFHHRSLLPAVMPVARRQSQERAAA